ncbi:hypothetical protein FHETE_1675 [Fusarium heterosporum]|uniref:Uncharacterized protein n=1 Tax=Fusarium heterosporum TaxID=42747 RepID=A0A8H5TYS2_FUSHE|nr:hypothetical protein FHETE_1675 [Fusarium heterosporum]
MSSDYSHMLAALGSPDFYKWLDDQRDNSVTEEYRFDEEPAFFYQDSDMNNSSVAPTPRSGWDGNFQQSSDLTSGPLDTGNDFKQESASNTLTVATHNLQVANEEPQQQAHLQQEVHQVQVAQPPYQALSQQIQPCQPQHFQYQYQGYQLQLPKPELTQPQTTELQPVQLQPVAEVQTPQSRQDSMTVLPASERHEKIPKKFRIPAQLKGRDASQEWLISQLNNHTREYQGYIDTPDAAGYWGRVFFSLSRAEGGKVTCPSNDATFPKTHQEYRDRVRQIFEAICDWTSRREWRAKMGSSAAKKWTDKAKADRKAQHNLPEIPDEDLIPPAELIPSVEQQWKNVIHYHLSDIEIELLSSKILDEAIRAQKGENFIPLWSNNETQWEEFDNFGER